MNARQAEILKLVENDPREFICRLKILDTDAKSVRFSKPYSEQVEAMRDLMSKASMIVHLKPRQIGRTTVECAYNFDYTYWSKDAVRTLIVTHHDDSTDAIFGKIKHFHETLPRKMRRETERSNRKELIFSDTKGGFRILTAGGKSEGRSWTYQRFHAEELAFWPNAKDNWASVTSTLHEGPHHRITILSTPNGPGNLFHEKVMAAMKAQREGDAGVRFRFSKWSDHRTYRKQPPKNWEPDQEEWALGKLHNLTRGQLYWRHEKVHGVEGIGIERFRREYPLTIEDGFMVFDGAWFDVDYLNEVLPSLKPSEGELRTFERPQAHMLYAIGVDPAWCNGGDYATAQVLSSDGHQVATLSCRTGGEILFAQKVADLAVKYNGARVLTEANTGGAGVPVIRELRKAGIRLWYAPPKPGSKTPKNPKHWTTHRGNKEEAYAHCRQMVNGDAIQLNDMATVQELIHIREVDGRIEGQDGSTDDHADALVLAEWNRRTLPQAGPHPSRLRKSYTARANPFTFHRPIR